MSGGQDLRTARYIGIKKNKNKKTKKEKTNKKRKKQKQKTKWDFWMKLFEQNHFGVSNLYVST